ncbi:syntaxin-binding protein 5 isoform X2 [Hydra vulgaris]|uniref:Syntaxin-binding protein 5 isoform X2 n=1 Tax=Hydra vulgaris TaxID=6087 RepID=A0ABM4BGG2_HYDVU
MKKFAGIKRVLDGLNGTNNDCSLNQDINDKLTAEDFILAKVGRYGLPYHATCIALDHVQKLLAIGTATGAIRICGKPGVECHINHETNAAVTILLFLINEGGLVSVCNDASLHIWSIRQNKPALIQSLNFKKERITAIHNPFGWKWLYVGTERGNVYIVNVETFRVSGYVIQWNHVIDVTYKHNPGPVVNITSNPQDENKLLLTFESGICVLWDVRSKKYTQTYQMDQATQTITCVCWNGDGRQFMAGHWNGATSVWNYKNYKKPEELQMPHGSGKSSSENEKNVCCPILKIEWYTGKEGDVPLVIFSGGMSAGNKNKGLTLIRGRSKNLVLSDFIVDFQCLLSTPRMAELPEPLALFVLLRNEIVVFDLLGPAAPSLPWFQLPFTFDIHESPITCIQFYPECPNDLLTALHCISNTTRDLAGSSKRVWPLTGGQDIEVFQAPSLIITGHADGSIKFWDATSNMLILCFKLNVSHLFEHPGIKRQSSGTSIRSRSSNDYDDPFAIQHIQFDVYDRILTVVCQSYFLVTFSYSAEENNIETSKLDVNFLIDVSHESEVLTTGVDPLVINEQDSLTRTPSQTRLHSNSLHTLHPPVKTSSTKWSAGMQPVLFIQQITTESMCSITSVSQCAAYGLVAFGNTLGVSIVDFKQKCLVIVVMSSDLGVAGDWTDFTTPKVSLSQSNSIPFDQTNGMVQAIPKRRERSSRMFSSVSETHAKLKRHSSANPPAHSNKDHEDLVFKENVASGSVQSLCFTYSYTKKNGNQVFPALWVGTSVGNVAVITLNIPPTGEQRYIQPVMALVTDTHTDHRHCVLDLTHLDSYGNIIRSPFEQHSSTCSLASTESSEKQYICITTEKSIKVLILPWFKTHASVDPVGVDAFIVKADSMPVEGGNCLGCLTTDGFLKIFSLPSLHPLLDLQCGISLADYRMIKTFTFGKSGEAIFLSSPTEIQRIVFTKHKEESFSDDQGCLFTLCQLPQPKPRGFFETLFGSTPSGLDRDELFGPKSGALTRHVAVHKPGSGMETLRCQTDSTASAVSKAQMLLIERGQNLSHLEETTARMNEHAQGFSSAAKALADKYQRKKWYQL